MDKKIVDKLTDIKKKAQRTVDAAERELNIYHKQNVEVSDKLYPVILKAIQTEIFDKGLCYKASYEWLSYADRTYGPHYQLLPLGEIIKYNKRKKYTYEDGVIFTAEQLDDYVFKIRIMNRYFTHYYPKYDLLKSELNITVEQLELAKPAI